MGLKVPQNYTPGPGEEQCRVDDVASQPARTIPDPPLKTQTKTTDSKTNYSETHPVEKPSPDLAKMAMSGLKKAANFFGLTPFVKAVSAAISSAKTDKITPEQYITIAQVTLTDLEVQIYTLPPGIAQDVLLARRNDLVNKSYQELQKVKSGNPLNGKNIQDEAQKLKTQVADFDVLDQLEKKTFTVPSRLNKDGLVSKQPSLVTNLKNEMEEALLNGNDEQYAKAVHKLEILKKYSVHLEMKQQLATLLREAAPLPIKHFIAPFNLDYKMECAPVKDNLYAMSEIPCGVIDDSPFFKTYKELKEKNPDQAQKFEEGFWAVYGNESISTLDEKAADSDAAFKKIEDSITSENEKMQSAGFEGFLAKVDEKEKQAQLDTVDPQIAKRHEMILAHILGLTQDKEMDKLFDDLLYPTLAATDEALVVKNLSDNLISSTQALIDEATHFRYTGKSDVENERINLAYQKMTRREGGDSKKVESVEMGDAIQIGNAHDYVGATDAPDAPDFGKFHENGLAYESSYHLGQLQDQLRIIQSSTILTPKDKLAEMWKIAPQIRSARLDLLKIRLAEEMGGLDKSVQDKAPLKDAMDQISRMNEKTDPEVFAKVTQGLQKEIEKEALKKSMDDFDKVISEVVKSDSQMKREVDGGIYGINDGMRTGIFTDEIGKLNEARALLQDGKYEEARARFLTVMDAGKHKALFPRFGLHEEGKQIVKDFARNVAITVVSGGVASMAAAPFRAAAALRTGFIAKTAWQVGGMTAEGTAFYGSETTLQGEWTEKSLEEHGWGVLKSIMTLGGIKGAMHAFEGVAARVIAGAKNLKGLPVNRDALLKAWMQQASVFKKIAFELGKYSAENVGMIASDLGFQVIKDRGLNSEKFYREHLSGDAIVEGQMFLCALKLGNAAAEPFLKKVTMLSMDAFLSKEQSVKYKLLMANEEALNSKFKEVYERKLKGEAIDTKEAADFLVAYKQHMAEREAYIKGLPGELLVEGAATQASAQAQDAEVETEAALSLKDIKLIPESEGVFSADTETIEALKQAGQIEDAGEGVYRYKNGDAEFLVVHKQATVDAVPTNGEDQNPASQDLIPQKPKKRFGHITSDELNEVRGRMGIAVDEEGVPPVASENPKSTTDAPVKVAQDKPKPEPKQKKPFAELHVSDTGDPAHMQPVSKLTAPEAPPTPAKELRVPEVVSHEEASPPKPLDATVIVKGRPTLPVRETTPEAGKGVSSRESQLTKTENLVKRLTTAEHLDPLEKACAEGPNAKEAKSYRDALASLEEAVRERKEINDRIAERHPGDPERLNVLNSKIADLVEALEAEPYYLQSQALPLLKRFENTDRIDRLNVDATIDEREGGLLGAAAFKNNLNQLRRTWKTYTELDEMGETRNDSQNVRFNELKMQVAGLIHSLQESPYMTQRGEMPLVMEHTLRAQNILENTGSPSQIATREKLKQSKGPLQASVIQFEGTLGEIEGMLREYETLEKDHAKNPDDQKLKKMSALGRRLNDVVTNLVKHDSYYRLEHAYDQAVGRNENDLKTLEAALFRTRQISGEDSLSYEVNSRPLDELDAKETGDLQAGKNPDQKGNADDLTMVHVKVAAGAKETAIEQIKKSSNLTIDSISTNERGETQCVVSVKVKSGTKKFLVELHEKPSLAKSIRENPLVVASAILLGGTLLYHALAGHDVSQTHDLATAAMGVFGVPVDWIKGLFGKKGSTVADDVTPPEEFFKGTEVANSAKEKNFDPIIALKLWVGSAHLKKGVYDPRSSEQGTPGGRNIDMPTCQEAIQKLVEYIEKTNPEKMVEVTRLLEDYGFNAKGKFITESPTTTLNFTDDDPMITELNEAFERSQQLRNLPTDSIILPKLASTQERELSVSEIGDLKREPASSIARKIMNDSNMAPATIVEIEGRRFYLSKLMQDSDGRKYFTALYKTGKRMEAFLFYASNSGGGWRYSTHVLMGAFSKGGHYTQETQPFDQMLTYLRSRENDTPLPVDKRLMSQTFDFGSMGPETRAVNVFIKKAAYEKAPELKPIQEHQPGKMFKGDAAGPWRTNTNIAPGLKDLNTAVRALPKDFIPDFGKSPVSLETMQHTLLGECTLYRFEATLHGRKVYWDMAVRNSDGLGWVERIKFADAEMNRFGGHDEIIDSGFLTSKPLEYRSQMDLVLSDSGNEFNKDVKPSSDPDYVDIRGILGRLDLMQEFYHNLPRLEKIRSRWDPFKPRVVINLDSPGPKPADQQAVEPAQKKPEVPVVRVTPERLEEWDIKNLSPVDLKLKQQLQDYKNKKYSDLVSSVLNSEMEPVDAETRRFQTDEFKKDLKDAVTKAKTKIDAQTLTTLELKLRIHGYDTNGIPLKVKRPNLERYRGDARQLTGFLMIDGSESFLLPAKDKGSISVGAKVAGQKASDYLPLPAHADLTDFHAQITLENGKYFITPTSIKPVEMTLGGKSKNLEVGKKYQLMEGAKYKIGSSELEFYPKKSPEEIYDIDHAELSPTQRGQYFAKTILAKSALQENFSPQQTLNQHLDKMNQRRNGFILPEDTHAVKTLLKFILREEEALRLPKGSHDKANKAVSDAGFVYDESDYLIRDPEWGDKSGIYPSVPEGKNVAPRVVEPKIPTTHADPVSQLSGLKPNEVNKPRNVTLDLPAIQTHGPLSWETNEGIGYKDRNEDAMVWGYSTDANGKPQLYVVVLDGMGGHHGGDKAAEISGNKIHEEMGRSGDLREAFQGASKSVSDQLGKYEGAPGAVAAGFQIVERGGKRFARIVHVGDAAIKVLRKNQNGDWQVVHATQDENDITEYEKISGQKLSDLEKRTNMFANIVKNALGLGKSGQGPVAEIELKKGDRIIGMSDGLTDNASTEEMLQAATEDRDVTGARGKLMELAKTKMKSFEEGAAKFNQLNTIIKAQKAKVPRGMQMRVTGLEAFGYTGYYINSTGELLDPVHKKTTEPWVALTNPPGHWMNENGHVFNDQGVLVDRYKPDNVSVFVYDEK